MESSLRRQASSPPIVEAVFFCAITTGTRRHQFISLNNGEIYLLGFVSYTIKLVTVTRLYAGQEQKEMRYMRMKGTLPILSMAVSRLFFYADTLQSRVFGGVLISVARDTSYTQ